MIEVQDLSPFVFWCDLHGRTICIDIDGTFIFGKNCWGNSWQNVLEINKFQVFNQISLLFSNSWGKKFVSGHTCRLTQRASTKQLLLRTLLLSMPTQHQTAVVSNICIAIGAAVVVVVIVVVVVVVVVVVAVVVVVVTDIDAVAIPVMTANEATVATSVIRR